jgi:hypothetical protein
VDHSAEPAPALTASRYRTTLIALTLLAYALRAIHLGTQALWSDEDITLDRSALAVRELVASLPVEHGPLYFVLMRGWTLLAGAADFMLRYPSLAAGVVAVPLAGYLGARLAGRTTGVVLALIMAVNPFQVWYGQEARMYTLLAALGLAALAGALRAATSGALRWWLAVGVLAALAVYSHYFGALILFVLAGWAAWDISSRWSPLGRRGRSPVQGWAVVALTVLVLYAPWLPRALGVLEFGGWREPTPLVQAPWLNLSAWSAGRTAGAEEAAPIVWLYALLALVGLARFVRWLARRTRLDGTVRALLYAGIPLVVSAALLVRTSDADPRYYFAVVPAFYLLVAAGVTALPGPGPMLMAALLALSATQPLRNLYADPQFQKQAYRPFLRAVEQAAGHEDTVLFLDGPALGLARRYEMADSPVKIVNLGSSELRDRGAAAVEARIAELAADYPHLWLASDGTATGLVEAWLDNGAYPVDRRGFQHVTLSRYYVPPSPAGPERASGSAALLERPVRDSPVALTIRSRQRVAPGEVLPVDLAWVARRPLAEDYKVSVRLVPASGEPGQPVAADRWPTEGRRPTSAWRVGEAVADRHGLLVPPGAPAGAFRLQVVLYAEPTLEPIGTWLGPAVQIERGS